MFTYVTVYSKQVWLKPGTGPFKYLATAQGLGAIII